MAGWQGTEPGGIQSASPRSKGWFILWFPPVANWHTVTCTHYVCKKSIQTNKAMTHGTKQWRNRRCLTGIQQNGRRSEMIFKWSRDSPLDPCGGRGLRLKFRTIHRQENKLILPVLGGGNVNTVWWYKTEESKKGLGVPAVTVGWWPDVHIVPGWSLNRIFLIS